LSKEEGMLAAVMQIIGEQSVDQYVPLNPLWQRHLEFNGLMSLLHFDDLDRFVKLVLYG
jgi:hypothetical protein